MAKSIRSKAKRKLRAAKREKLAAKERLRLLAAKEQEEGSKMVVGEDEIAVSNEIANLEAQADSETGQTEMEVMAENQPTTKWAKKKINRNKLKRLKGKKKQKKYKW